jgi:hypothetical protein
MSNQITQAQLNSVANSITVARSLLNNIRNELTGVVWSGNDADRFHRTYEAEVDSRLGSALIAVYSMDLEAS